MEYIDGDRNVLIVVGIKDPDFARRSRVRHTVTVVVINKSSLKDVVTINTTDLLAVVLHDGVGRIHKLFDVNLRISSVKIEDTLFIILLRFSYCFWSRRPI